eukprot:684841-Pelagomonas_calceolata.AAC.6
MAGSTRKHLTAEQEAPDCLFGRSAGGEQESKTKGVLHLVLSKQAPTSCRYAFLQADAPCSPETRWAAERSACPSSVLAWHVK